MYRAQRYDDRRRPEGAHRLNEGIRVPNVRVVCNGQVLGIMPTHMARQTAQEMGLDLVEMAPNERPPVCHIMDYGKWKYDKKIQAKKQNKANQASHPKTIAFTAGIDHHDLETKINQAKNFLTHGKHVIIRMKYKGRQIVHVDHGLEVLNKVVTALNEVGYVEASPKLEGKNLFCRISPK